ncbi:MAG TPA: PAS domain S-box protein [Chitinophagaceae bacterium]|jgi:hypothetical protein|nr:PAS domain S-box protein [Chitinophagaceae bacterium]
MSRNLLSQDPARTDFRAYEATPGISVIVLPDAPVFTIAAASSDFLIASGRKREEVIGKGYAEVFPECPETSGAGNREASFENVLLHKTVQEIVVQQYNIPGFSDHFSQSFWRVRNVPLLGDHGGVDGIIHSYTDCTHQVLGEQNAAATRGIERAYHLFMNAPVIIGILKGDDYVIELANEGLLEVWGRTQEVVGQPLLKALPELESQGFTALMDEVRTTGEAYYAYEYPIKLHRNGREEVLYFDFVYKPFYDGAGTGKADGVVSVGHDVTEQVEARKTVAEMTERLNFRNALFEAQNETTPDGVLIVDAKGKILLYNRQFAEIWNMPQEIIDSRDDEAALRHAMTLLVDPEAFKEQVDRLYRNKKEKSHDLLSFLDGRVIERFGTSILAENGLYYGWAWYFRDITEQKRSEEAIQSQHTLIRTITDNATSTLFMMNAQGYCTFMNAAGEKMFGYSQEEIRSMPIHYLIHHHRPDGSPYPKEECPLDRALPENSDVRAHRDLFFRKNGTSFPVSCAASPIFDNGIPVSTVIEVRDISLEIEAEQALLRSAQDLEQMVEERTRELKQLNDQLKQFSYAASHDLQEPLRKINFFTDRLLSNLGTSIGDDNLRIAGRIQQTAGRMQTLIDDLLGYSNAALGTMGFREVDLGKITGEVLEDMEATILQKEAVIHTTPLPRVSGDERQLRQLFQNLIGNALKYHKPGEAPSVTIRYRLAEGRSFGERLPREAFGRSFHEIEVKDQGIGFAPEEAEQIFGLFQRLHGRAEYQGTGIGLAIAQRVVENHKGYIWAESVPGAGAAFRVLLPAAPEE